MAQNEGDWRMASDTSKLAGVDSGPIWWPEDVIRRHSNCCFGRALTACQRAGMVFRSDRINSHGEHMAKKSAKKTSRYINYIPKTIPAGKILCHGGVIPQTPDQKPAVNGFRPWMDEEAKAGEYGPCNCGWSGLPHHMPLAWLETDRKEYDARHSQKRAMSDDERQRLIDACVDDYGIELEAYSDEELQTEYDKRYGKPEPPPLRLASPGE